MITLTEFKGKKVAVFGLGKTGNGAVRALSAGGAEVFAWDDNESTRNQAAKEKYQNVRLEEAEKWPWGKIKILVLSPGVPLYFPEAHRVVSLARGAGAEILCDIELLYHANPEAKFVGITGTNGKSTTTALIHHIITSAGIQAEVGGNIGISALDLNGLPPNGIYVIEVSSYQLDLLHKTRFNVAALLNITPDHIDRHGNMRGYINSKKRIFHNQRADDSAVIGIDDDNCRKIFEDLQEKNGAKIIPISNKTETKGGVFARGDFIYDDMAGKSGKLEIGPLPNLIGEHNLQNVAAAFAVCRSLGIGAEKIINAVKSFPGLDHRMQTVAEIKRVKFINDSKATNAEAAEKAILCFENIFWIAGGLPKEGGIKPLARLFPRIKHAFLIGAAQEEFAKILQGKVKFTKCGDLQTAVEFAAKGAFIDTEKNPVVLLSPACASFDQFKNFEERGKKFVELVSKLKKKVGA